MIHFFGVLLISASAYLTAVKHIEKIVLRQKLYMTSATFWEEFSRFLSHTHASPKEIMLRLSAWPGYALLEYPQNTVNYQAEFRFSKACQQAILESPLAGTEIESILLELAEIPGVSHLEDQLEKMGVLCRQLRTIAEERQKQIDGSLRLWRELAAMGSAIILILLL